VADPDHRRIDYAHMARVRSRPEFIAACPHCFLVRERSGSLSPDSPPEERALEIYPVRKTQSTFSSMITVGRTANHDIVISDVSVGAFHAYFRRDAEGLLIVDTDSRHGTFIGPRRLPAKRQERIEPGCELRFGRATFRLVDSGRCWELLRRGALTAGGDGDA